MSWIRSPGTFVLGRIGGTDFTLRASWLPLAALIALASSSLIGRQFPFLGGWRYVVASAFVVAFTVSILVHELAHALMARKFQIPVREINLGFFAARSQIMGERRSPLEEFSISVAGPLVSLAVGALALLGTMALPDGLTDVVLFELAVANLLIGGANLLPGLPLDGGKVIRALVWKLSGNPHTGTIAAVWTGRILAICVLGTPLAAEQIWDRTATVVDFVIVLVISWFLWAGSARGLIQTKARRRLPILQVRTLARRAITVCASTPLSEAVRNAFEQQAEAVVVIDGDSHPIAIVPKQAFNAAELGRRPETTAGEAAKRVTADHILSVDDTGEEILAALQRTPSPHYVVLDTDGLIYGVLVSEDVERAFRSS